MRGGIVAEAESVDLQANDTMLSWLQNGYRREKIKIE
jgi:hypothetical protein